MSQEDKSLIEVINILEAGECPFGHKIGEKFDYPEERGRICAAAFHTLYPYVIGIRFGAIFPWEEEEDSVTICCPDYKNPVVFKITRQ
ncbi:MAG: TIGR04076 family protein [Candidatus Heimdallarchaeota archaeon]|nr:TIGR04076 family protein [Candidatus Heimdallarchaeota archaeon]MCK4955012.1 TIGR04076 family protein [Candidatus Heimdallarchaeota archaeon]